ncbi:hypothetical protein [Mycolicibacterium frederiksbergense]|uniref:hypothetical protein n=1 Tax=Mycolicibacterium frederiksbergense TaxID=117567 RepID=UPI00399C1099
MSLASRTAVPVLAGGIALAGLLGVGLGTAGADPGRPCGQPNAQACAPGPQTNNGPQNNNWQGRNIDQARNDHQPFMHNGQRVEPMRAGNGDGWGFWFLGQWIRL